MSEKIKAPRKIGAKLGQEQLSYSWHGKKLSGQILPVQMLPWHLESVKDGPRSLPLKFGQNRVSISWDIADIEFVVVLLRMGWVEAEVGN